MMTPSRRWLFGGILVAIVVFLFGFLVIVKPAQDDAASIQLQADTQRDNNVRTAARLELLRQQSAQVPAKLQEIAAVKVKMPSDIKQAQLIRSIEQEAVSAGLDLTGIAPATPVTLQDQTGAGSQTVALPMTITAEGRYANIKTFVNGLERLERAFLITNVGIEESDQTSGNLTLTLDGQFYSLPESAITAPAPAGTDTPQASASAKLPKKHPHRSHR